MRHSYEKLGRKGSKPNLGKFGKESHSSKTVYKVQDNKVLSEYGSLKEAAIANSIGRCEMGILCNGNSKNRYKGLQFLREGISFTYNKSN